MSFSMERWHDAVGQRFSVRKYKSDPNSAQLETLFAVAKQLSTRGVRIALAQDSKAFSPVLMGNRIKGTAWFAAFISSEGMSGNVGYLGEAFVLECTAMGLGTCWLGIYNKKVVMDTIKLEEGESLTCITPIGMPTEKYIARPRKTLDKLTGLTQQEFSELPQWQQYAINCARLAPSATNAQPWRFVVEENAVRICPTGSNFGYGKLDRGIAMLHMELGASHDGVTGDWKAEGEDIVFRPIA